MLLSQFFLFQLYTKSADKLSFPFWQRIGDSKIDDWQRAQANVPRTLDQWELVIEGELKSLV